MNSASDVSNASIKSKITLAMVSTLALLAGAWLLSRNNTTDQHPETPTTLNLSEARNEDGLFYAPNESTPFTGVVVDHYDEGSLKYKTEVVDGKLNGLSQGWHENGQLQVKEHYQKGVSHGMREKWRQDGSRESQGEIKHGKFEGTFRKWHPNGQLAEEMQMVNGVAHGEAKSWYDDGKLKAQVTLKNGEVVEQEFFEKGATQ